MNNRIVECASRAGRDFSEFMAGEKNMIEALQSAEEFTEQLRLHGCVNHHFVNFMMMKAIMKVFDDMQREEQREERRRKRAEARQNSPLRWASYMQSGSYQADIANL